MAALIQTFQAKRFLFLTLALTAACATSESAPRETSDSIEPVETRRFSFTYTATIDRIPDGQTAHVYVPIALETAHQRIEGFDVEASFAGRVEHEPVYGNRFWHGTLESGQQPTTVTVRYTVERKLLRKQAPDHPIGALGEAELQEMERFLRPSERVVVGHEILSPILAEIHQKAGLEDKAKSILLDANLPIGQLALPNTDELPRTGTDG